MNCEELILSVIVILLMMLLIAFVCTCRKSNRLKDAKNLRRFSDKELNAPDPKLIWGGVPFHTNSVMDHSDAGFNKGFLPITNSMTALHRLEAETVTPPWSSDGTACMESKAGDYVEHFMQKRSTENNGFRKMGSFKNATAVRYMKMEK